MKIKEVTTSDFEIETEHNSAGLLLTIDTHLTTDTVNVNTFQKFSEGKIEVSLQTDSSTKTIIPKRLISDVVNASNFGGVNACAKYFNNTGKIQVAIMWTVDGSMLHMEKNARYIIKFSGTPANTKKVISVIRDERITNNYYTYANGVIPEQETKEYSTKTKMGTVTGVLFPFDQEIYDNNEFIVRLKFSNGKSVDYAKEEMLFATNVIDSIRDFDIDTDNIIRQQNANKSFYIDFSKYSVPVVSYEIINNTNIKLMPFIKQLTRL